MDAPLTSLKKPFETIQVGDEAELYHRITAQDVEAFAKLSGDRNPLHLNAEYAQRANFRQPVVYGMLSASFISTMIGMVLPGRALCGCRKRWSFIIPLM
ncbi:MAG: hypothetical protein IPJ94_16360 [Chloroflexi bacterium]|nr:hypothetical protein [Chloroflexota bacterium]